MENVASGIGEYISIAPMEWFDELREPAQDSDVITDTHTFKDGLLGFMKFQLAPSKNRLDNKGIGDAGSQSSDVLLQVFMPGSYVEQHDLLRRLRNKPLIALGYDEGYTYQVGNRKIAAYMKKDFTTGTDKEGNKGYLVTISATSNNVKFYAGAVQRFTERLPNNGYPVFLNPLDQQIDNLTLYEMRQLFVRANNTQRGVSTATNITSIYNTVLANIAEKELIVHYRDANGDHKSISVVDKNISSFLLFLNQVRAVLPVDRVLTMYGNRLLIVHPDSEERYVGFELSDYQYLMDDDDFYLEDADGALLLLR